MGFPGITFSHSNPEHQIQVGIHIFKFWIGGVSYIMTTKTSQLIYCWHEKGGHSRRVCTNPYNGSYPLQDKIKWVYFFHLLTFCIRLAVNCGNLPDPVNGNVSTPGGTTFESLAEYRCNEGYKLSYPAGRTCLSSGLWSETAPMCEPEPFCGKLGK